MRWQRRSPAETTVGGGIVYLEISRIREEMVLNKRGKPVAKQVETFISDGTRSIAHDMEEQMARLLAKGGKYNVGATGTAAENLSVVPASKDGKKVGWGIVEGGATKANYFIRHGFGGIGTAYTTGRKKGKEKLPPASKIKEWAAAKGISLYNLDPSNRTEGPTYTTATTKKGKTYIRARRGQGATARLGLLNLRRYLAAFGSSKSHWVELYPEGKPRFDYVQFVLRKHRVQIERALFKLGYDAVEMMADYIIGGSGKVGYAVIKSFD